MTARQCEILTVSEPKASSDSFFPHPQELLFYIWKYNVNFIRFSAVNFVIFILERLIKGGIRGESGPLLSSTQFAVCHCLNSSWVWMGLWKRPAVRIRNLLEHFRIILKWDLYWHLRWKLMLTLLAAVIWGNAQCWSEAHYPPSQSKLYKV